MHLRLRLRLPLRHLEAFLRTFLFLAASVSCAVSLLFVLLVSLTGDEAILFVARVYIEAPSVRIWIHNSSTHHLQLVPEVLRFQSTYIHSPSSSIRTYTHHGEYLKRFTQSTTPTVRKQRLQHIAVRY